jgi:hypothetical protein
MEICMPGVDRPELLADTFQAPADLIADGLPIPPGYSLARPASVSRSGPFFCSISNTRPARFTTAKSISPYTV